METIIKKVWVNKYNNQKLITIPKDSNIEPGDYVQINKVKKEDTNKNGTGQSIRNTSDGITDDGVSKYDIPTYQF